MLEGFACIVNDTFLVKPINLFAISVTTWGCAHLLLGLLDFCAGFAVIAGLTWAKITGTTLSIVEGAP